MKSPRIGCRSRRALHISKRGAIRKGGSLFDMGRLGMSIGGSTHDTPTLAGGFSFHSRSILWQRTVTRERPPRVQVKSVKSHFPAVISSTAAAGRISHTVTS